MWRGCAQRPCWRTLSDGLWRSCSCGTWGVQRWLRAAWEPSPAVLCHWMLNCTYSTSTLLDIPSWSSALSLPKSKDSFRDPRIIGGVGWGLCGFHVGPRVWLTAARPAQNWRDEDPLGLDQAQDAQLAILVASWGWNRKGLAGDFLKGGGCHGLAQALVAIYGKGLRASRAGPVNEE